MTRLKTYHAPAERSNQEDILAGNKDIEKEGFIKEIFEGMPEIAVIMDGNRQIIYANEGLLSILPGKDIEQILGSRVGEAIDCVHSEENEGGCGTSEACRYCGAVNAILKSSKTNDKVIMECRIVSFIEEEEVSFDYRVTAKPIKINGSTFTMMFMQDISDEKRKMALERIFFHDILNTAGGIQGFTGFLSQIEEPDSIKEYIKIVDQLSHDLVDEIHAQRALVLAENEDLKVVKEELNALEIVENVKSTVSYHIVAAEKEIVISNKDANYKLNTDKVLIKRVLINLLKNALEATEKRGEVLAGYYAGDNSVIFYVHNDQYMTKEVQLQVFKRSFSTKGRDRGLGTYSIKLLAEKYLKGKVWFETDKLKGTTFYAQIPKS